MSALPSSLDAVTVYREGAICRRIAKLAANQERQVRLGGLPLSLEPGSLRARLLGGDNRVVDVRAQFDVKLADEIDVPTEQRAWEEAGSKLAQLELQRQRLNTEISELQTLRPSFLEHKRGEPPRAAPVEAMLALGDFTESELAGRLERRRKIEQAITDAKAEQQLRQQRMQESSSSRRAERAQLSRVAVVTFAQAVSAEVQLELEYRVPGARWVPSYSLMLERGLTNGALQMRASIAQDTGEDWSEVSLSLSTASSSRRADMPELKSLRIGRRQEEPPRSGWREPPPGLDSLFESYDDAVPEAVAVARPPPPAPPPPPPPQMQAFGGMAKDVMEQSKSAPMPMRPGAAPMKKAMNMPAPSAAPAMAAPARMRASAPADLGAMAAPKGGGFLTRSASRMESPPEEEAMAEISADSDDGAPGEGGGGTGEYDLPAPVESGLDASFGDYARLCMGPPEARSQRGRLTNANEWDFAFVAGVSLQIDVVMAIVSRAQRQAMSVQSLALPSMGNPVHSVNSFDYRYDCGARLDVPSTGKWVLVPVMACAVGLTPEYVCVPSVEPKVYRTLTIANRSTHALLPGPVDVTTGDEFLMTTTLPAIGPGAAQSHRLGLGVEEAIKVSRKTQFKETTGGFLGGSTVLPHDIEIELNNRLAAPALIEVRERVPVVEAEEKDLKVEEAQSTPPWEKVEVPIDGEIIKGARRWRVTVPAGQTQKLTAQFAIRMPTDRMIVGGNRRN